MSFRGAVANRHEIAQLGPNLPSKGGIRALPGSPSTDLPDFRRDTTLAATASPFAHLLRFPGVLNVSKRLLSHRAAADRAQAQTRCIPRQFPAFRRGAAVSFTTYSSAEAHIIMFSRNILQAGSGSRRHTALLRASRTSATTFFCTCSRSRCVVQIGEHTKLLITQTNDDAAPHSAAKSQQHHHVGQV